MNGVVKKLSLISGNSQQKTGFGQNPSIFNSNSNIAGEMMNFSQNETLTVDRIVRSCFANPERRRFPEMKFGDMTMPLAQQDYTAEYWINRSRNELPTQYQKFNQKQIKLFDQSRISD